MLFFYASFYAPNDSAQKQKLAGHPAQKTPQFGAQKLAVIGQYVQNTHGSNLPHSLTLHISRQNLVANDMSYLYPF